MAANTYFSSPYDIRRQLQSGTAHFYFDYLLPNETHREVSPDKHLMLLHKRRLLFDCCVFVLIVYPCQLCKLQWLATELIQGSCCHCSLYAAPPFEFKLSSSLWFLLRLLGLSSLSLTMALLSTSNVHSIVYCDLVNQSDQSSIFILSSSTVTILSLLLRRSKYIFNVERFIELVVEFDIYRWPRTLDRCESDAH
jgi:hypothetical protein